MLDRVKKALRISHTLLDGEIEDVISAARAELIRSGVADNVANADEIPLVNRAIVTYCQAVFCNDTKRAEGYQKSFEYQMDSLRKSYDYKD